MLSVKIYLFPSEAAETPLLEDTCFPNKLKMKQLNAC
jgi:hypothetical protein